MNQEITLVTAFFNIGRERFKAIPRSDNKYLSCFKFWARMKNHLVIYTQPEMESLVYEIRNEFGLRDKTTVIVLDDIYSIEPEIYSDMKNIAHTPWFKDFRLLPNATSNIPEYSYLMLLKSYFLQDAVQRNLVASQVAWIDFGFNHGGDLYINPEEFDFEWKYNFSNHIHYFYYEKNDEKPVFEIVRRLCDCIMGCLIIAPANMCEKLWLLNRNAMRTLTDVGLIDDDQLIHLMSYRKEPESFNLVKSDWFLPLKEYGGTNLISLAMPCHSKPKKIARKIKHGVLRRKRAFQNAIKLYRNLVGKS